MGSSFNYLKALSIIFSYLFFFLSAALALDWAQNSVSVIQSVQVMGDSYKNIDLSVSRAAEIYSILHSDSLTLIEKK